MQMKDDPHQTARDTTNALTEQYIARIQELREKYSHRKGKYYIQVLTRRDTPSAYVLHSTFVTRLSLPDPKWENTVYEVDNTENHISLCWALPSSADARQISLRPDLFDAKLVEDCVNMLAQPKEFRWSRVRVKI